MRTTTMASVILIAAVALFPVRYSDCGSTATASPATEKTWDWPRKSLKQDWNYLFHPERINQCKPRELKNSEGPE
jgi:hypothetical protein